MANRPITIEGVNSDDTLDLSDKGITKVARGDTVTWKIGKESGVATITGIDKKPTATNVFSDGPAPVAGSSHWRGTIDPGIPINSEEEYTINYTKTNGNQPGSFDPKIQVNS